MTNPVLTLPPEMRSSPLFVLAFTLPLAACGQFDYGLSGGGVFEKLHGRDDGDLHASTEVGSVKELTYSVAAFYRERPAGTVGLGFDLSFLHRSFQVDYGNSGLGYGYTRSARVKIDQLYLGVKPEVSLNAQHSAVLRFGVMAGFRSGGKAVGTTSGWRYQGPNTRIEHEDFTNDFGGDMRFAVGFGFRASMGERWAITFDPEATFAFTSMLKGDAVMRGSDIGLRIGLSRLSKGKSISHLFKDDKLKRNAGPGE